jgi:hypothetical protein
LGTHQGAVSRERLDYYLDEFTFRFDGTRGAGGSSSCASPNEPWLWGRRHAGFAQADDADHDI